MPEQHLYIFNPENELAIADGGAHYMAPLRARIIAGDLSPLPLWYAGPDDYILVPDAAYRRECEALAVRYGLASRFLLPEDIGRCSSGMSGFVPWGWSPEIVRRLSRWGADVSRLPSAARLSRLKELSHRACTIAILRSLSRYGYTGGPDCLPVQLTTPDEVRRFLESASNTVLKAPWSGSGKGIAWGRGVYDTTLERWSNGILQRQGAVIGEPFYDKVADLALEFFSDGAGNVSFAGYSWFSTDNKGVYRSNWLASDETIFSEIVKAGIEGQQLEQLQQAYLPLLSLLVGPVYRGYFGIDMMIYRSDGNIRLHPCIEMNLRMNMGMVARIVYDRYVDPRVTGRYYVDYFPDSEQLNDNHQRRSAAYPVKMSSGRICSGYLSLTPVTTASHYRARIEIAIPE